MNGIIGRSGVSRDAGCYDTAHHVAKLSYALTYLLRNRTTMKHSLFAFVVLFASLSPAVAAAPRALPDGTLPADARLQPPKDLNGYFPFTPPKTKAEWDQRAEYVRRQIL